MEFRILGPLEIRDGQRTVELGAAKQRALLGVLLLHANELVPTSRLVDELWGERPPATSEKLVQGYVHALRKQLAADVIVTQGPGYKLHVASNGLDLLEFERLIAEAREAPLPEAVELRRRALSLWRGRPLADVVIDGSARFALAQLEELRLSTQLERIEGELELGRHAAIVGELESLAAAHPYQERVHALLLLALYRSGGRRTRSPPTRRFAGGSPTSSGFSRARSCATSRRRSCGRTSPSHSASLTTASSGRRCRRPKLPATRRRAALEGPAASSWQPPFVLVLAGAAVAAAVIRDEPATVAVPPNSVAVIDPDRNRVVDAVPVGTPPGPVAAGAGPVWVANVEDRLLTRIAPRTGRVQKYVPLPATPTGLAVGYDAVWVAHGRRGQLSKVDPTFGRVTDTIDVTRTAFGTSTGSVAVGFGDVWAVYGDSTLARVDPRAVRRTGATFAGVRPSGIAVGAGSVWVANGGGQTVERFNPATFEGGACRAADLRRQPADGDRVRGGSRLGRERRRRHRHAD